MIEDLKHFHAEHDPWQLIDEGTAFVAFLALIVLGYILLKIA